ncbi:diguanylate cyclase (GGDEF)-like protein [Litorivivens lipolytica]|uniref:Diguanylate cyclase (GGDEF)-like protein n=1 Tax=Litorivivens lipolytica TaxID=1524264 RepID=A0A7W4W2R7_9GAMM|nr:GGDEF domain-containing protein [Litorivivens lipolytica]MBB3046314.1 diguanylate cyclase (GGDEF)-like protein [Litorivivens lipolytica]
MSGFENQKSVVDDAFEVKQRTVDGVHAVVAIVSAAGLPFILARDPSAANLLEQAGAITFTILMLISWMLRAEISLFARSLFIISLLAIAGVTGLVQYGMLGAAPFWLIVCALFSGIVISPKAGRIASGLVCAVVALVGLGFVLEIIEPQFNPRDYVFSFSAWANYLIGGVVVTLVLVHRISSAMIGMTEELLESREALKAAAHYDDLTGAIRPNLLKEILNMELRQRPRDGGRLALLYLDLDRFKAINDDYGHEAGDEVLIELVKRIRRTLRGEDVIARLGGDEFAVLLRKIDVPDVAVSVARKIRKAVLLPIEFRGVEIDFGASIGIAIAPEDASDIDNLLRKADQAMYMAKRRGSNQIALAGAIVEPASLASIDEINDARKVAYKDSESAPEKKRADTQG